VLKFPGFSLEHSLDFYIEEYGTLDTTRQVIFVEIHRRGTPWLFQLDEEQVYDKGSYDFSQHRRVYQENDQDAYAIWFKYLNCTQYEYH
jgi:hypothetical protein